MLQLRGVSGPPRAMLSVLVVAPDLDLRRSLQFAIEAEGYAVTWQADIAVPGMPRGFDCTVVDHHALGDDSSAARAFLGSHKPSILLANKPHELSSSAFRTVLKPHLGPALTAAIRDAIEARNSPT
jgi:CheY-like chemotaxis protein